MKVERLVDGARGCHDGLRDDLTPIDTCEISIIDPHRGTIDKQVAHLSHHEETAHWWTGRGRRQGL
jgi:hypothetical protein